MMSMSADALAYKWAYENTMREPIRGGDVR